MRVKLSEENSGKLSLSEGILVEKNIRIKLKARCDDIIKRDQFDDAILFLECTRQ